VPVLTERYARRDRQRLQTIMTDRSRPWSLSHYRVVSKLGAGGMGEVYLAKDTRLNRKVAIKLLPETLTRNEDSVRRFVQEAQSASALNHPNIITVYDIGETDDGRFIVMELVSGTTLGRCPRRDMVSRRWSHTYWG
jgi:serine/threonine protein kinase